MHDLAHKICPQCDARVVENHRFCPSCGFDLSGVAARGGDPYLGVVIEERYRIEQLLGTGAMGRVYRAEQAALRKPFAIKILSPQLTHDPDSQARFANEAYNAASLNHPNVVSVVDYGRTPDGITYLVMEYIEGQSLEQIIYEGFPLARERVADLLLQILAALTEAHGLGVLHRDLKPENILVQSLRTRGELLKVLDFGIAKLMDDGAGAGPGGGARPGLTSQGAVCGTPEYMSPEQACGLKLDQRSDLYAVGVILYQMLTGRPPFESEVAVEILHRHIHEQPKPPSEVLGRDPDPLDAVCLRAMAKDREARFADAAEFREAVIEATRALTQLNCGHCGERMRAADRFCPACGTPTPELADVPVARRVERRSTRALRQATGEATAEVLLRALPSRLAGAAATGLIAAGQRRLEDPKPGLYAQVIAGPAGSGRTRLLDEIADRGEQLGWIVASAGSEPTGAMTALWPIREAVASLLGLASSPPSPAEIGRAANLLGLSYEALPGLQELFGVGSGTTGIGATTVEYAVRRRECFTSAVQALLESAGGRPLLLTFDDIDRWDAPSRRVLQQLVRARSEQPVLILIATAEDQRDWLRSPVVELPALERHEIQSWAEGLAHAGSALPERLASHGPLTPFELELALRSVPAEGQAIDWAQAVTTWLASLAGPERQVLELCSVLGERVEYDDLDALRASDPGHHPGELTHHLIALVQAGLLRAVGEAPGESSGPRAWTFRSRRVREQVRDTIDRDRARHLHRQAALRTAIAQLSPTVRALFLLRAQPSKVRDMTGRLQTVELIEALREAAVNAVASFDDLKAVRLLRTALKACRRLPDQERLQHEANLVAELIAPFCFTDRVDEAIGTLRKILGSKAQTAPAAGGSAWSELNWSELNRSLGQCLARKRDWKGAVEAYQRALGPLIAQGRRAALLELYADLARAWAAAGELPRALSELNEGLDMCTLGDGPRAAIDLSVWRYLLTAAELHERGGDARSAQVWAEHALYQAQRRSEELGQMRAHEALARLHVALDQAMLAEQHLGRGLEFARKLGDRKTSAGFLLLRAELRNTAERFDEAQRCVHEALRLAELLEWERGINRAHAALRA